MPAKRSRVSSVISVWIPRVLPHGIHLTPANETDRAGALPLLERLKESLPRLEKVLVDGGYRGPAFAATVAALTGARVEVVKRQERHPFTVLPQRWVVERSFAWLEKCRRLWRNAERLLVSSRAMVQRAFIRILLKRL